MGKLSRRMKRMLAIILVEIIVATNVFVSYADEYNSDEPKVIAQMTAEEADEMAAEQENDSYDEENYEEESYEESYEEESYEDESYSEESYDEEFFEDDETGEEIVKDDNDSEDSGADDIIAVIPQPEESKECTCSDKCTAENYDSDCPVCSQAASEEDAEGFLEGCCTGTESGNETEEESQVLKETEIVEIDNSVVVTAVCEADGKTIEGTDSFTVKVDGTVDVFSLAPAVEGFTFADRATIEKGGLISQLKKETAEESDAGGEEAVARITKTTSMSYYDGAEWKELTEDITIVFEYIKDGADEENTTSVKFVAAFADQDGNAIEGCTPKTLTFEDTLDLTKEPEAIDNYEYVEAQINGTVVSSVNKSAETDEKGEEITSYSYTAGGKDVEVTEDTEVILIYKPAVQEVKITLNIVDEEGLSIEEYAFAKLPEFDGRLALDDPEKPPVEVEGRLYKEAAVDGTVVTALVKEVSEEAEDVSVYSYVTQAGESVAVEEDTEITLIYEEEEVVVAVDATIVDEFGDKIAEKYTGMDISKIFDGADELVLDDPENPPVEKVSVSQGLFKKAIKYTYVKTTVDKEIVIGLKREATKETAELKDKNKEYIYSYTTDGESWAKIKEDTTIIFEYSDGKKTVYTYEDSNVLVTATLQHANAIPDDAEFVVTPVTAASSNYNYDAYMEALNQNTALIDDSADTGSKGNKFTEKNTLLYDIAFLAAPVDEDGETMEGELVEYQPAEGMVNISFVFKKSQLSDDLGAEKAKDVTVVHLPLEDSVKEAAATTAAATDISASDVKVEVVPGSVSLSGSADQAEFCLSDFSVVVLIGENGNRIFEPGRSVTYQSVLGNAVNYGIVAWEVAHSAHMDTNFATAVLSGSAQTTAGKYTGSHNPGNFIIADYTGNGWFTDCSDAARPFIIYTTEDAYNRFATGNLTGNNKMLVVDTTYTKEQLTAQVNSLICGIDSALAGEEGYAAEEIFEERNGKQWIDLTDSPAGTYYVNFSAGEYAEYAGSASKMFICMNEDQNIVFNVPDASPELHKFEISIDGGNTFAGSDMNDASADIYARRVIFNMPNAALVNVSSSIAGVVLCPKADFYIGSTSTGWLVANKVRNGGEWHGVWQEMPDSQYIPVPNCFTASKTVNGEAPAADQIFTFKLEELKDGLWSLLETKTNNGSDIMFSDISYNADGTYYYRISEEKGSDDYQYDETKYIAKVEVSSAVVETGSLTTTTYRIDSVTYYQGENAGAAVDANKVDEIIFNNIKAEKGSVEVKKVVTGTTTNETFYFVLKDSNGNAVVQDGTAVFAINSGNTVTISGLEYGSYTIVETDSNGNPVATGKDFPYVAAYSPEQIEVHSSEAVSTVITNNYYSAEGTLTLTGTKNLEGRTLKDGEFYFTVTEGNETVATGTNDADGNITFSTIKYTFADIGEHIYTVSEVIPKNDQLNGVTYSTRSYEVKVNVTDNGDGTLKAEVQEAPEAGLVFENKYEAKETEITLEGSKLLTGREMEAGEFSFAVEEDGKIVAEGTNDANGNITFDTIKYEEEGTHTYKVRENTSSEKGGITYDDSVLTVVVEVTDDGEGALHAEIVSGESDEIKFVNAYEATGSLELKAKKTVDGKTPEEGEVFTFTLTGAGQNQSVQNNGEEISFAAISYDQSDIGKTYTYTVREAGTDTAGYSYDATVYTVTVKITDADKDGVLEIAREYKAGETGAEEILFQNQSYEEGSVILEAAKELTGGTLTDGMFTFTLEGDKTEKQTKTNTGTKVTFDAISYDRTDIGKTYEYTITEVNKGEAYITYDSVLTRTVKVTITAQDGRIVATPEYQVCGAHAGDGNAAVFHNEYKADGALTLKGTKNLEGRALKAGEFSFVVKEGSETAATGINDADGNIKFTAIDYTLEDLGTHTYVVSEVIPAGADNGITYSQVTYEVKVVVTDNGDGTLKAAVSYPDGIIAENMVFTNSYDASAELTLEGTKALLGRNMEAGEFSFAVMEGDTQVATGTNSKADAGKATAIQFTKIEYSLDDVGIHEYVITEVNDDLAGGVAENTQSFTVVVEVKDNGNGTLGVQVISEESDPVTFENHYNAEASLSLSAQKTVNGAEPSKDEVFTFEILENDEIIERVTNNGEAVTFSDIVFTQDNVGETHTYVIRESSENVKKGYTYDLRKYTITVEIKDNGDGTLNIVKQYSCDGNAVETIQFNNTYPEAGEIILEAWKDLKGGTLADGMFRFNLSGNGVDQTKGNVGTHVIFDPIKYTEADVGETYTYTIKELVENKDGYTFDTVIERTVVVTVTEKNGKVQAAAEYQPCEAYPDDIAEDGTVKAIFHNQYDANGSLTLKGTKILTGKALTEDDKFEFAIIENGSVAAYGSNELGVITFDTISYGLEDVGTHYYTIKELSNKLNQPYINFDAQEYKLEVNVSDNHDGTLNVQYQYPAEGLTFTNEYTAKGEIVLEGTKTLTGRDMTEDDQFSFEVLDEQEIVVSKGTNEGHTIKFSPIAYELSDVGVHTYTVREVSGGEEINGILYDSTVITVKVIVTDNSDGTLNAEVTEDSESIEFENEYEAVGRLQLDAWKTVNGGTDLLGDNQFTFKLTNDRNSAVDTKVNAIDGHVVFDEIVYGSDDIVNSPITYTISEEKGDLQGYTYDESIYTVVVTLTDDGQGNIIVDAEKYYKENDMVDTAVFNNIYEAEGSVVLSALKTLENAELKDGQFTFILEDADHNEIERVTNTGSHITFSEITYDIEDAGKEFTYYIRELAANAAGYVYDETVYEVKVSVSDEANNGTLSVSKSIVGLSAGEIPEFKNSYQPKEIYISKVDAVAFEELPGASMMLTRSDGVVIDSWISDGSYRVIRVDYDTEYTLSETAAPSGYLIAESITFRIDENDVLWILQENGEYVSQSDSVVTMIDAPGPEPTPTPGDEPTPTPGDEPTPTPGDDPTPTPGDEPTPTPGDDPTPAPEYEPSATPTIPEGEVLGARRSNEAVLGARRGVKYAVLGKRRRPSTGDSMMIWLWMMALIVAAGGTVVSFIKLKHDKKREK